MCGITAILAEDAPRYTEALTRMTASLSHRGPDGAGCQTLPGALLGHRRLSIIDLAGGAQPMADETGRYWITFNGEIYNFQDLRQELEAGGARFRTRSDTEVLLQAYLRFGTEMPRHLNGQFAFLIWDAEARVGFAARDRLGEKPLYWARTPAGAWLFASEIKALLASGLLQPRLDPAAVEAYLALLYVPPDRTIYADIQVLPPGHFLVWRDGQVTQSAYWRPAFSLRREVDPAEAAAQTRTLLERAVHRQMVVADVPVGAFLSGGLDSSTIVALMARDTERPITFAVGFGELIDELPYARVVAQAYRTDHHELQMQIPVGDLLERMAAVYDEPFADSSNIPTYLIAEFAQRHVKVVLSGDGGDEVFGGYEWYRGLTAPPRSRLTELGLRVLGRALRPATRVIPGWRGLADAATQAARSGRAARQYADVWDRHLALSTSVKQSRAAWWGGQAPPIADQGLRPVYFPPATVQELDRAIDFDVRAYLPGDILVKVDRAAMAHGLESRAPFLDVELVEFVWSLPWRLRVTEGQLKGLLRQACGDLWPAEVRGRSKQGFGAPIWAWIRRPDVQQRLNRVLAPRGGLASLLPGAAAAAPWLGAQAQWTLLCLGLWLERHPAAWSGPLG